MKRSQVLTTNSLKRFFNRSYNLSVILLLTCIILICNLKRIVAQPQRFNEFHSWTDVATIYNFSTHFRYDGDYGLRGVLTDKNWPLLYLRPSVLYSARNRLLMHGGAALFYNFFQDTEDLLELRPWVGVRMMWPRPEGGFSFSHYFRLELRAFYLKEDNKWDSSLRGRYQFQVSYGDFSLGSLTGFTVLTSIEPFFNIGSSLPETFGDRFRYNLGIGKRVIPSMRIDVNYLFHRIRLGSGELKLDDHVVRVRFFFHFRKQLYAKHRKSPK